MVSIKRGLHSLFFNPSHFCDSIISNYLCALPDKLYLSLRYRCILGHWINWKNPKTFTEKIQWLKIYNRNSQYSIMVDKYAVKKYVADLIGEEYIIPTLALWDNPNDIDWNALPKQFVLKTTHGGGGGGVIVCKDKEKLDRVGAIKKLKQSYRNCIYKKFKEWPYRDVPKKIIAEKYMSPIISSSSEELTDYKFYCFNGEPKYCQVIRDRHTKETIDFYDMDWNHQQFVGLNPVAKNGLTPVIRPKQLDNMKDICKKLSKDIPFIRVDLYVIDEKVYFGELTFYPASGFGEWTPAYVDHSLGDFISL